MKILLTGAFKYSDKQLDELRNIGFEIYYLQNENEKFDFEISEIEYVVCNALFLYHDIRQFKKLKYIQVTSAGLDRLPMEYILSENIKLFNARGVYSIPIAEWTVLKILEIYKRSKVFYQQQERHEWIKQRDLIELNERTACIIGYGSIGREIAKRLRAFNVKLKIVDTKEELDEPEVEYYTSDKLNNALVDADIIILTLPLTNKTKESINKEKFEIMKENSILVNISRGKIIKENDLIEQLDKGKFLGVILDVFQEEPLKTNSKLWDYNNTIITPHNCFVSDKNNERMFKVIKENIIKVKEGLK